MAARFWGQEGAAPTSRVVAGPGHFPVSLWKMTGTKLSDAQMSAVRVPAGEFAFSWQCRAPRGSAERLH
jgi:hypothetical protein